MLPKTPLTINAIKLTVLNALIKPTLARVIVDEGIAPINEAVGGYICAAFTVRSPDVGKNPSEKRYITAYVHDEGLLLGLPISTAVVDERGQASLLAGNMLIMGVDMHTGETVSLSEEEMAYVEARASYPEMLVSAGRPWCNMIVLNFDKGIAPTVPIT
jgi:hypothetical protein